MSLSDAAIFLCHCSRLLFFYVTNIQTTTTKKVKRKVLGSKSIEKSL